MRGEQLAGSEEVTRSLAHKLAKQIIEAGLTSPRSIVVALAGKLGSGKTTFTQFLAEALGIRGKITSPTFVIMRSFGVPRKTGFKRFYHLDAYRITKGEFVRLIPREIFGANNVIVVEWGDRVKEALPSGTIWVELKYGRTDKERRITIN